jgi:hypothetical protein
MSKTKWFASDDDGNEMASFTSQEDAREYAIRYGYTIGWETEKTNGEMQKTYYVDEGKELDCDHDQVVTCSDCAYDDGHLRPNVSCECGRSDTINSPIGEYDWAEQDD